MCARTEYSFGHLSVPAHANSVVVDMIKVACPRTRLVQFAWATGAALLIACAAPVGSRGQAAAEAAGAAAASSGVTAAITNSFPVSLPGPPKETGFMYVAPREGPPTDEVNRKALEQRAGKGAAKLLLESAPTAAAIFIDGKFVGRTPLLLLVPAGNYQVEMRGSRDEFGERSIAVAANETQRLDLPLTLRYPAMISVYPRRASSSSAGMASVGATVFAATLPNPANDGKFMGVAAAELSSQGELNRRAFEQRAGKDAAKLVLQSVPTEAMTYVDGTFVGRTPLLVVVPPGKYKVEMRGPRDEFGEQLVGALPNETQQLALKLALRYPAEVTVPR